MPPPTHSTTKPAKEKGKRSKAADPLVISREEFARLTTGGLKAEKLANHALASYGSVDIVRTADGRHLAVVNHARHDDEQVIAEVVAHVEAAPSRRPQSAHSQKALLHAALKKAAEEKKKLAAAKAANKAGEAPGAAPQS